MAGPAKTAGGKFIPMTPVRWKVGVSLFALVVGGASTVVTWHAVQAREAALADLAALRAHREKLQARAAMSLSEQLLAKTESSSSRSVPAHPVAAAPAPTPGPRPRAGEYSARLMAEAEDPVQQNHELVKHREDMAWNYRAFFLEMKFSPEQIERFLDIDAMIFGRSLDVHTVMRAKGLALDDDAAKTLQTKIEGEYERAVQGEFGDDVWSKFDQYRQTSWPRNMAAGFAAMATLADMPLDAQQGAQLAAAMAEATTRAPDGSIREPCRVDWDRVDDRAKLFLTPAQWQLFRLMESPGAGGGGARFVTQLNDAFLRAVRAEEAKPAPSR